MVPKLQNLDEKNVFDRKVRQNFIKLPSCHLFHGLYCNFCNGVEIVSGQVLQVDGTEKREGSGRRQKFSFCPALWRSRVICNLNVLCLFKTHYFHFRLLKLSKQALSRRIGEAHPIFLGLHFLYILARTCLYLEQAWRIKFAG